MGLFGFGKKGKTGSDAPEQTPTPSAPAAPGAAPKTCPLADMTQADVNGAVVQQSELTYYDGSQRTVFCTDVETPFPEGRLIVSRTDPDGIITHVNQAFVMMSGFSEDELIGKPHYILRHPDMPRVAFQGLWDTMETENTWNGYVKNLRRDGGFYWVYATLIKNIRAGKVVGYS